MAEEIDEEIEENLNEKIEEDENIPTPHIWKISHGSKSSTSLSDEERNGLRERHLVAIGHDEGEKQYKKFKSEDQAEDEIHEGDYFYLCNDGDVTFRLLGQFTTDKAEDCDLKSGWLARQYRIIASAKKNDEKYKKPLQEYFDKKNKDWAPNCPSKTVSIVPEHEEKSFEELILLPYFGITLDELYSGKNFEETQKENFREWLSVQKKRNGEKYGSKTVNSYVSHINTDYKRFQKLDGYTSLFQVQLPDLIDQFKDKVFNSDEFKNFNFKHSGRAGYVYTSAMKEYAEFLRNENIESIDIQKETENVISPELEDNTTIVISDVDDMNMTAEELGKILGEMYNSVADEGLMVAAVHTFGIKYGKIIRENQRKKQYEPADIVRSSGIKKEGTYVTELLKALHTYDCLASNKFGISIVEKDSDQFQKNLSVNNDSSCITKQVEPCLIDPETQKDLFKSWMENSGYEKSTIDTYISAMNSRYKAYEPYNNYNNVYQIQQTSELDEYTNYLSNDKGYNDDNHQTFKNGLDAYRNFLEDQCVNEKINADGVEQENHEHVKINDTTYKTRYEYQGEKEIKNLSHNRIFFGAPGTGKSYMLNDAKNNLIKNGGDYERVTFHPDYSYANFVGTYKPVNDENGEIKYEYVPGPFMRTFVKAMKNAIEVQNNNGVDPKPHLLIIEEINRADVAAVFGDVFQLLDRDDDNVSEYPIETSEDMRKYLSKELNVNLSDCEKIKIPDNMFIWATMNSADQGVFPMDTAFKRRWDFTYMSINNKEDGIDKYDIRLKLKDGSIQTFYWNDLRKAINDFLANNNINEDKQLGPYFISTDVLGREKGEDYNTKFSAVFKDKVIMYLYEDAAKQRRSNLFNGNRYSDICENFDDNGIDKGGVFLEKNKEDNKIGVDVSDVLSNGKQKKLQKDQLQDNQTASPNGTDEGSDPTPSLNETEVTSELTQDEG